VIVDCALYEDGRRHQGELELEHLFDACHGAESFVWIGLYEPSEEEFDAVRREFQLHELAVEDAIRAHQRPKLEAYGESLFMVLKTATYNEPDDVEFGELLIFIGESFIVSVRHGEAAPLTGMRQEVEGRPELLRRGPSAVLHAIVDRVVDDYQPVIEALGNDIAELEAEVFVPDGSSTHGERIYRLKREVLEFRRAVVPLIHALERLTAGRFPLVVEEIRPYFRDVEDHLLRVVGQIESYGELLTNALQASLIQVQVRQSDTVRKQGEDVRKISAWAAIIAVPTAIAGIYGMNFEHMPELEWTYGYPLIVAAILAVCALLYHRLKRAGWL
jgi:magnesium transporter